MQRHGGHWKERINDLVQTCQDELKKTTAIGKKMISASKTNSCLHESFEELGELVFKAMENGELNWDNPKAKEIIERVKECKSEIDSIEKEVNKIKFPGGVEVSSEDQSSMKNPDKKEEK